MERLGQTGELLVGRSGGLAREGLQVLDTLWVRLCCRPCCWLGVGAGFSDADPGQTTEGPPS